MPRSRPASNPVSFHKHTGQYYVTRAGKRIYLGADPDQALRRYHEIGLGVLCSQAQAHRPIFNERAATGPETAVWIALPSVSQVIYREITEASSQVWLALDAQEGFELFVQIGVPVIPRLKDFRPAMKVVGPALSDGNDLPSGVDERHFRTDRVKEPRFFHEHFTGTDSWILCSETVTLPTTGRYYVVAYAPSGQTGKLWLSIGQREMFEAADLAQFGAWKKAIRKFHEIEEMDAGLDALCRDLLEEVLDDRFDHGVGVAGAFGDAVDQVFLGCHGGAPQL